jgi:hypothetical protein
MIAIDRGNAPARPQAALRAAKFAHLRCSAIVFRRVLSDECAP